MADFDWGTIYPDAAAASGGSGGWASSLGDVASTIWGGVKSGIGTLGDVAKTVSPLLAIGSGVMGAVQGFQGAQQQRDLAKQQTKSMQLQQQSARDAASAAAPLRDFGTQELTRASAGQVDPAIQTQIDQWKAGALQKARDYIARSGNGDSGAMVAMERWINQQAEAMKAGSIQDMQKSGTNALTGAAGAYSQAGSQAGSAASAAGAESTSITNLIAEANKALAQLGAAA